MRSLTRWLLVVTLVAVALTTQAETLKNVFKRSNLGVQVAFLEQSLGPARTVTGNQRSYVLGPCTLQLTVDQGAVTAMDTDVNATCNPDLRAFFANDQAVFAAGKTFGSMATVAGNFEYQADCLALCGNAYDPSLYAYKTGFHANGFISIVFSAVQVSDEALKGGETWAQAMTQANGEDYVADGTFNCDGRYNHLAAKALKDVRITHIKVGDSQDMEPVQCPDSP